MWSLAAKHMAMLHDYIKPEQRWVAGQAPDFFPPGDTRVAGFGARAACMHVIDRDTVEMGEETIRILNFDSRRSAVPSATPSIVLALFPAGVTGLVQQFVLRPGDVVTPMLRPAGILVPAEAGRRGVVAGFDQIQAQVLKPGMFAEATWIGKPFTMIPVVVTQVQDVAASGP